MKRDRVEEKMYPGVPICHCRTKVLANVRALLPKERKLVNTTSFGRDQYRKMEIKESGRGISTKTELNMRATFFDPTFFKVLAILLEKIICYGFSVNPTIDFSIEYFSNLFYHCCWNLIK